MYTYNDAVSEYGKEFAAALSKEEFDQFMGGFEQAPASRRDFIPFDEEDYIGTLEFLGHGRMRTINEKLYRMEEGF